MEENLITFRSVTEAMRSSRILERTGISSLTVRTPKQLRAQGCGYSIRLRRNQLYEAKRVLDKAQARYQKLYRRRDGGPWQEVTP